MRHEIKQEGPTNAGRLSGLRLMSHVSCLVSVLATAGWASAAPPIGKTQDDITPHVAPAFREAVGKIIQAPTVSTKYTEPGFAAHANVYAWLLAHPDRVSLGWQRLQVQCVEITDAGNGKFRWTDQQGSELTWQAVGTPADAVVWYATGKVKAAAVLPLVPVRAVAVLRYPGKPLDAAGAAALRPELAVYVQTDSRTANLALRMLGPAAPKMAEQGAEQLLYFFSGVARYLYKHPDQVPAVLAPPPNPKLEIRNSKSETNSKFESNLNAK
jgi:hypothetical protein